MNTKFCSPPQTKLNLINKQNKFDSKMLITIVSPCRNYDAQNVEINLKETLMFICMQKMNFSTDFVFWIFENGNFENA